MSANEGEGQSPKLTPQRIQIERFEAFMRAIATFEAKCGDCGHCFPHPSLGDLSYGEKLFCTLDGSSYAYASAFTAFGQRVSALKKPEAAGEYWAILASLADPISGRPLSHRIHCPQCSSGNLASWDGRKLGVVQVPDATFVSATNLSSEELSRRVTAASKPPEKS
ncbi:MAG: hypothetical protein IT190_10895 [Microbacteriaceae bacterium]|nr:hypothetical protein [Microbacteriaceae bacterium]